ncbi:Profilin [Aphelenchoides besseyi]|nr:Profilin [Aphelenchoides besseyi]
MSGWDAYVTNLIDSSEGIKRAAIATDVELKRLIDSFNDIQSVPAAGADLEGVHYVVPRVEDNLIFGKKGRQGFFCRQDGFRFVHKQHDNQLIVLRISAILIAIFEGEAATGSAARTAVEKLATYLSDSGY